MQTNNKSSPISTICRKYPITKNLAIAALSATLATTNFLRTEKEEAPSKAAKTGQSKPLVVPNKTGTVHKYVNRGLLVAEVTVAFWAADEALWIYLRRKFPGQKIETYADGH